MLRPLLAIVLSGSWLVACAAEIRPPTVELRPAPVKAIVGGGGFCPPGHAKQGRC